MAKSQLALARPPKTKDELWWLVKTLWGVELPRVKVCPDHTAPFDAFAEAYFGNENNWALWYGSRGTGKSYMLALLAMTKAAVLEINVTLLGGSMAQSQNVQEHVESLLLKPNAPMHAVANVTKTQLLFTGGNWIRPLPASQKTVRGPHPQMTLLDEIDEMEKAVYDAAMGQAMTKPNARGIEITEMVVASSTWQNPIGTFQEVRDDALKKGLPVRTWCFKEVLAPNGWMPADFIERKRATVPAEMFRVEYELGEPAGDSRAFDLAALERTFIPTEPVEEVHRGNYDKWVFEQPLATATYATGADWAKESDKTVIATFRTDVTPMRLVHLIRMNRHQWPYMIEQFNTVIKDYWGPAAHDGTGIGNVVNDMIDERVLKVVMVGRSRADLLSEYVTAVENDKYRMPRNTPLYNEHKAATVADVFSPGSSWDAHLPDSVAACALAHRAIGRIALPASPNGVKRDDTMPKWVNDLDTKPQIGSTGDVVVREPEDNTMVFWL